jgi:hypothetical protein
MSVNMNDVFMVTFIGELISGRLLILNVCGSGNFSDVFVNEM